MVRTAIYARYSDEAQNDSSIEQQFRLLRERAAAEGWTIVAEFEDRAYTGSNAFRPGFKALREAAYEGRFDLILTESVDRLSRDMEDMAGLHKRLQYRGVSIFTLLEGLVDETVVVLKGYTSSVYLKDLGRRVHRGLTQRVMNGESAGGWAYGYDIHRQWDAKGKRIGGSRVINEEQAAIVRRIFEEYAGGKSPRKIAFDLNAEGIPTQNGGHWRDSTIYGNRRRGTGIINNELYIGKLIWGRQSFTKNPDTGHANGKLNDEEKWIRADVPELRIVDDELWNRVKAMQCTLDEKSPTNSGKQRPKRLFSFLLKCGECGGGMAMVGRTQYGCSNARYKGPSVCTNRLCINEQRLEEVAFTGLQEHIMDPVLCDLFTRIYREHAERIRAENSVAFDKNKDELERTERAIGKLADAIANGIDPALVKAKSDSLLSRKRQLETALQDRSATPQLVHSDMGHRFRVAIGDIIASFKLSGRQEASAQRIRNLVNKIVLTPDADRKELIIDLHGDLEKIMLLAAQARRKRPADGLSILEQSELGEIRWLAGNPRRPAPQNPASHHRLPVNRPVQGLMAGAKAHHQNLQGEIRPQDGNGAPAAHPDLQLQVVMAGAAGSPAKFKPVASG